MRIESAKIKGFGRLADLELTGLNHPLVVITGSNEAGKSTFFEFLKTMLFGIYPTNAATHRYVPWSGRALDGELSLRLDDGTAQTVCRRLRSTPEGQLLNGSDQVLRNQTLPAASHISRDLFDSFYALRLDDLAAVHGRSWEEVQQRLLSELSPDSVRPVNRVLRELEENANALWRADRRGKPRARQLHEQLRVSREAALEARKRDAEARRLAERADTLDAELDELQRRRLERRTQLKRLESLRPLDQLVRRRDALQELVGDARVLSDLPEDAAAQLQGLSKRELELDEDLHQLDQQLERTSPLAGPLDVSEELLLEVASRVREWKQLTRDDSTGAEVEASRRSFQLLLEQTLGSSAPTGDSIWAAIEGALAEALHEMETEGQLRRTLEERTRPATLLASPPAVMALSGLGWALAASLVGGPAWIGWLVGGTAALGTAIHALGLIRRHQQSRLLEHAAYHHVEQLARDSGLSPQPSAARLAESFATLSAARRSLTDAERAHEAAAARRREQEGLLAAWLKDLKGRLGDDAQVAGDPLEQLRALEMRLADIELRQRRAELAAPQVEHLQMSRQRLVRQLQECTDRRRLLEERLSGIHPDLDTALERLDQRQRALRGLAECDHLLEGHGDATATATDIGDGGAEQIALLEDELETISQQSRHLSAETASRRTRVEHLRELASVADLEGEILSLRQEIERVRFQRDRLTLLASLVQRAQQRFRERHQPDVLRRASNFLSTITGERYRRLDFDRESGRLEVYNGTANPLPVSEPLSQGTRDQIYLALRLAVVDHLDRQQEALPLFLDEILVNWDRPRRLLGYEVLKEVVSHRQLFVFTCHEWLAAELQEAAGACRISLSAQDALARSST